MTPTINTRRLALRALTKATPRQVEWLRDPLVTRYSQQRHKEPSLSAQLRYVDGFLGNSHLWGLYLVETGQHIGNISATHDPSNNVADVGILLGEVGQWGKGYAGEAWNAACGWLLDPYGGSIRKLEAGCARGNEAMMKIIKGSGFAYEGERPDHFLFDGLPMSAVLYGRLR